MQEEREYLERMAERNNGLLLVDDVLKAARNEKCVLHKHFEWDDTEAAAQYRREQARGLIQKCNVVMVNSPPTTVRAFVSLPSNQRNGGGYWLTSVVLSDTYMRLQLLDDIQATITRWKDRLYLLDRETAAVMEQLEESITKNRYKEAA